MEGIPEEPPKPVPPAPAVPSVPAVPSYPAIPRKIERPAAQAPEPAKAAAAPIEKPKAPPAPIEPPKAPSLGELLELGLTALINAPGVFFRLEARPVPGPASSFLTALAWGALFFGLNLVHVVISRPGVLQAYPPWQVGIVGVCGLALWSAMYLLGSSFVYGLGRAMGSAGDFDRALLVAAMALAAAPAQALCSWFPTAWVVPTVVGAWIAACGVTALFKANPWAARAACAVVAGAMLAVQYGAGVAVEKYSGAAQLAAGAAQAAPQLLELQQQAQAFTELAAQMPDAAAPTPGDAPLPGGSGKSSLDLLRGPGGEEAPADAQAPAQAQRERVEQLAATGAAMNKSAIGMLDSLAPLLNNPAITANMNPRQKADFDLLNREIRGMKADLAAGKPASTEDNKARMQRIQGLMMRAMGGGMPMPMAAPGPPSDPPKAAP